VPFTYQVPVPTDLASATTIRLKEWLLNPGDFVDAGFGLALVQADGTLFEVCANGRGLLDRHSVAEGDEISDRGNVCVIAADGENIPYNRPYSTSRRVT